MIYWLIFSLTILIIKLVFILSKNKLFFEKLLIINSINNIAICIIASLSVISFKESYLDISFIYIFFCFVANNAFLIYFKNQDESS